jgi:hypothetical protein
MFLVAAAAKLATAVNTVVNYSCKYFIGFIVDRDLSLRYEKLRNPRTRMSGE